MQRRHLFVFGAAVAGLALTGCSRTEDGPAGAASTAPDPSGLSPEEGLNAAALSRGFTVGVAEGAPTAYVFFDPQCPHCSQLWKASTPLLDRVRMVWLPVAFISPQSKAQGALLMTAADPVATMTEHETSLLAGQGGLAIPERTAPELEAAIDANTDLLGRIGADSVPFLLARTASGKVHTNAGGMDTAALAMWLGVQP